MSINFARNIAVRQSAVTNFIHRGAKFEDYVLQWRWCECHSWL